jgi:hypothetical protein
MLHSGLHLERGDITAFDSAPGRYDYLAADITAAYNSTRWAEPGSVAKVSLVTRQLLYLRPEEAFLIYDRVETTADNYLPKFLLHALSKPRTENERLLAGNGPEDGILETRDRRLVTGHRRGVLTQVVLLPSDARTLKIGGPNYASYVEQDGDQSNGFTGVNLAGGDPTAPRETAQPGLWRTEVEPLKPGGGTRFLNVLLPRLASDTRRLPDARLMEAAPGGHAVRVGRTVVLFAHDARPLEETRVVVDEAVECILVDAVPGGQYYLGGGKATAGREGVVSGRLPKGIHTIRLAR